MTITPHKLADADFLQDWSNAGLITANDDWSGVASITGYIGDLSGTTGGRDARTLTAAGQLGPVDVVANSANPNNGSLAGGVHEFAITNPTIGLNGSGTADAPNIVVFLDSTGRQDVRVRALIRDIDSTDDATQQLVVQWRTSGGSTWSEAAYFADVTATGATMTTNVDVTLPAGANNSAGLEVRFLTTNAVGTDESIGIDDINISSTAIAGPVVDTTPPVLIAVNPADPDDGATAVPVATNIVLRFSETVQAGTGSFTLSNGTDVRTIAVGDAQVSISGSEVTINPATDLVGGTAYQLTAPAGVLRDAAGNNFAGLAAGALDFTTLAPLTLRTIGEIQGLGHASLFLAQVVLTRGVVTAIDSNGFYIQSAIGATDGDDRTSDGIFVFTSAAPSGITVGQLLEVQATVREFLPGNDAGNLTVTQLSSPSFTSLGTAAADAVVIGTGGRLPPTQIIDNDGFATYDPAQDGIDFWESLEGMRITIDAPTAISNTNNFGETYVVASGGAGATGQAPNGALTLAANDFNPERIQLDNDNGLFAGFNNAFSIGDRLSNVTGVVSYGFESFELLVTEAVTTTLDATQPREETLLAGAADKLSVASYNLENVAANSSAAKLAALAGDIVNNLRAPDIIGVQEIQDANGQASGGSLSGQATADALIAAIIAAGGPAYAYAEVAPTTANSTGGAPNANIRNGYLYDPSRVSLVAGSVQLIEGSAYSGTRRPLVASFEFNGETVTLVNVHMTSRLGSDGLSGAIQPPVNAGDQARINQAQGVRDFIDAQLAVNPQARIAVLGDFNGFGWEASIGRLTANGATQNLSDLLPAEQRFSFQFDGNNQQLDHILATSSLAQFAGFDAVALNSQQTEDQRGGSDHDAMLALFEIPVEIVGTSAPGYEALRGTGLAERILGLDGNDRIEGNGGNDWLFGGEGNDVLVGGSGTNRLFGDAGVDSFGGETVAGVQIIDGGAGVHDRLVVSAAGGTVTVDLVAGTISGGLYLAGSTIRNVENVDGRAAPAALVATGDSVANVLNGGNLADILSGGGGNDRLIGGLGPDTLTGGIGNDRFEFRPGDVDGDMVLDFDGRGAAWGDTLVFQGFGPGASISNVGEIWTINYGAGLTESFQLLGVETLAPGDVVFG
ncbi:Ig-like domain-containing protein [Sandarakinorhabdus sp.]|uniref:Ig-like domain-containing protein n=1 Tax=Sandarakinorhabdus sp. TaxID=1916663 RepID=UPI003342013A